MSKLPALRYREVIKILTEHGFLFKRQAKGSHEIWFHPITKRFVTIPHHAGQTIKRGTLLAIIRDSGLSKEMFKN